MILYIFIFQEKKTPCKRRKHATESVSNDEASKGKDTGEAGQKKNLPPYTQWFDIDNVNKIEEECANNIFIGLGLEEDALLEAYKTLRNKIVRLYRKNPLKYLSVTECVRNIDGDASLVMKVHTLLDYWGIINFQARNELGDRISYSYINAKDDAISGNTTGSYSLRYHSYHEAVPGDNYFSGKLNTPFDTSDDRFTSKSIDGVVKFCSNFNSGFSTKSSSIYPKCCSCGVPCKASYYILGPNAVGDISSTLRNNGLWCSLCYGNSNYPISLCKSHFVRIDVPPGLAETACKLGASKNAEAVWSPEDFEKLYEAIRKYGTDWQNVAQYMGQNKTPSECIYQFVNAPLESEVMSKVKLTTYMEPSINENIKASFPFFDSPNTIVALLSFCASVVSPVVASSAAKAALRVIFNNTRKFPSDVDQFIKKGVCSKLGAENVTMDAILSQDANNTPSKEATPKSATEDEGEKKLDEPQEQVNKAEGTTDKADDDSALVDKNETEDKTDASKIQTDDLAPVSELPEVIEKTDKDENPANTPCNKGASPKSNISSIQNLSSREVDNLCPLPSNAYMSGIDDSTVDKTLPSNEGEKTVQKRPHEEITGDKEPSDVQNKDNNTSKNTNNAEYPIKTVKASTVQLAAAAALGAAAARAEELAILENDRLSQALPSLISLKIKRIKEKLRIFKNNEEQMKKDKVQLERELNRILKCNGILR
ncbi:conserved hypothetical protein [Theileria equi strain WA]|uniref:SWIRM domain-containing protein n=1 Tax=Theileria equi strain WA TaxID=1537102 RepID=L1LCQ2_THEEQ|nr:conserved hypothetical protein [Theileria equi strain WA]EKX73212.1 conserved hypothetical protein [Theileria equi strain WA]|eukprot:XP_004832664.1 conserved hypothetical protein [Theileria equi strain WA]